MTSYKEFVDNKIAGNKIVVFSKTWCPHCANAKKLFADEYPTETVEVVELDERDDGSDIQAYLGEKTGARSVPRIFIHGSPVGGNDVLQLMHRQGKLSGLIAKA